MIVLDGSVGEGGGQVFRTALSLSLATGRPLRIEKIRARRKNPGLAKQHLACLRAAVEISGATAEGADLRSQTVEFTPGPVQAGRYRFDVGSAGSTTLVLQTILPALALADDTSDVVLLGGTHNPLAPTYEFLAKTFLPLFNRMGPNVRAELERYGFYPVGGGRMVVEIDPCSALQPLPELKRDETVEIHAVSLLSRLPAHIAGRELAVVQRRLRVPPAQTETRMAKQAESPANLLWLELRSADLTELITVFGEKGRPAEMVAEQAVEEALAYFRTRAPVGPYLADQLLLPGALAGAGSFLTMPPTSHLRTNAHVIQEVMGLPITMKPERGDAWRVRIGEVS